MDIEVVIGKEIEAKGGEVFICSKSPPVWEVDSFQIGDKVSYAGEVEDNCCRVYQLVIIEGENNVFCKIMKKYEFLECFIREEDKPVVPGSVVHKIMKKLWK